MSRTRIFALCAVLMGASGCLASDESFERGWGHPLAVLPGDDGNVWGVYAESEAVTANAALAVVEWQEGDPSGRNVQGETDAFGVTTVHVQTAEGVWSAAVDAEGQVVWADPLPEDPTLLAGAIGDAGIAVEDLAASCETCSGGIGPLLIIAIVIVVAVAAGAAVYVMDHRDPPRRSTRPGPSPDRGTSPAPGGQTQPGGADCGPEPTGDFRKDPAARRRHFQYLQCMGHAGR